MDALTRLLLNTEKFGGGLEDHPVNHLLRYMNFIEPNLPIVPRLGLLHLDIEPILLLHRVTPPLVIARLVRLVVELTIGVVNAFPKQDAACRASSDGVGIAFGKDAAQGRAACPQANIRGRSGYSGAAGEQADGASKGNHEQDFFHKNVSLWLVKGRENEFFEAAKALH